MWAAVRPLVRGSLVLAVAATAAGTGAVCVSRSFHLSAGLTDVKLLQASSGKPQGRFHLEERRRDRYKVRVNLFSQIKLMYRMYNRVPKGRG